MSSHVRCRVLIVEDHPIMRQGLVQALKVDAAIDVVDTAATGREALEVLERVPIDVALVDLNLPDCSGLDLIAELAEAHPLVKSIACTAEQASVAGGRAAQSGALGFVQKNAEPSALRRAILEVWRGGTAFEDGALVRALRGTGGPRALEKLSEREREVLTQIGWGLNVHEIAERLGCSHRTVETHRLNIRNKLCLPHHDALIHYATWLTSAGPGHAGHIREDVQLLRDFERRAIPEDEWTHRAHLRVAFSYLCRFDAPTALRCLRRGIDALNRSHGKPNAYHETITVAWVRILAERMGNRTPWMHSHRFLDVHADLVGPDSLGPLLVHYTRERLLGPEARAAFVEPDRAPLPPPPGG